MKKTIISACMLFAFSGCSQGKAPAIDPAILKNTVIQYNQLLADGYRTLDMNGLVQAATEERATKAYYHMSALGEERKRMEAKQLNISFIDIKTVESEKAEIKTREEWNYTHINIDSKEVEFQDSITYNIKYTLIRQDERWLVSDIDIEGEEKLLGDNN